jgi:hypothetical protein
MLDRSASNLFQPASDAGEPSATVPAEERARPFRAARGASSRRPRTSQYSRLASAGAMTRLRSTGSRMRRAGRYLPLSIGVLVFAYHAVGGGRPAARQLGGVTTAAPQVTRVQQSMPSRAPLMVEHLTGDRRVRVKKHRVVPVSDSSRHRQGVRRVPRRAPGVRAPEGSTTSVASDGSVVSRVAVAVSAGGEFGFER